MLSLVLVRLMGMVGCEHRGGRKLDKVLEGERLDLTMLANDTHTATYRPERLTWDEICQRYPDEWVVMAEIEWVNDMDFEFRTALVLAHHKMRKDVSPSIKAALQRWSGVGSFFTGRLIPPAYELLAP